MQQDGIEMGPVGHFDVNFLRVAAVKWPELEDAVRNPRGQLSRRPDPATYGTAERSGFPGTQRPPTGDGLSQLPGE